MRRHIHFSPWPIAMVLIAIGMAVGVFVITQRVQQREAVVAEMNRQLLNEQQTIRVLDAEWAYLTRPQRLETLAALKAERDIVPPVPTPIATVTPEQAVVDTAETVSAVTQTVDSASVKAPEPAGTTPKKTAAKTEKAPAKKKVVSATPKKTTQTPVRAAATKPSGKKAVAAKTLKAPSVKAAHAKTAPAKTKSAQVSKPVFDVFPIQDGKGKSAPAQLSSYKPRGGIARPIVE
jgi:hypothetical protein